MTGANKAVAAGLSGALTTVVAFALGLFGVTLPPEVVAGVGTIITTALVWLVPHGGEG